MERGIGLIVVGTLLQEEFLDFRRRDVAVVNLKLAILFLIEDMIVVEDGLHIHPCLIRKDIAAIRGILIDGDIAILSQLEDIGKQIRHTTSSGISTAVGKDIWARTDIEEEGFFR